MIPLFLSLMAKFYTFAHMKRVYFYRGGLYQTFLLKLLIVLLLLTSSRLFLYFFNSSLFGNVSVKDFLKIFFYGLRFDVATLVMVNGLFIFLTIIPFPFRKNRTYQQINDVLFYIFNSIAFAFNFIDVIYFRFTLKRTTADFFNYLGTQDNMNVLIPQFIKDFWYILILWLLFIFLMIVLCRKIKTEVKWLGFGIHYYIRQTLLFLVSSFLSIIAIRGGFQLKPISIINAGNYVESQKVPLLINTPFAIIKTFGQKGVNELHYFKDNSSLETIYTPYHIAHFDPNSPFKKYNVVILILESFSKEHFGILNPQMDGGKYKGYTPFLDSLIRESLCFDGFANGKRSIEAIPAVVASMPSLMDMDYITSAYAGDKINSIANLLKQKGYATSFFHGGTNGTMNFDSYVKSAGFDQYYGRTEYDNDTDFDGKWGIFDEPFLQFFAKKLNNTQQPFLSALFTLSSHHPYTIPEKYKNKFPKGKLTIQQSISYSDYSLRKFFQTASRMPWFDNTLFVITADHTSEANDPYYQTSMGAYEIPIFFYKHNSTLKGFTHTIISQIDIMPSILGYLNFDKNYNAFGINAFDEKAQHFSVTYLSSNYQLIKDNYLLIFNGKESTALYNIRTDTFLKTNLVDKELVIKNKMEIFLKAIIQQYNNRLVNNGLIGR